MQKSTIVGDLRAAAATGRGVPSAPFRAARPLVPALLLAALGLASCASSIDTAIAPDGGARLSLTASVPADIATKFRKLAQASPQSALFDISAIRTSLSGRAGIAIESLTLPTSDSLRADLSLRSLGELAASNELKDTALITLSSGPGWNELRIHIDRAEAAALARLFPGIDPYVMDALSPPALEEDPVTVAEYRSMLSSILGQNALPALDAARIRVTVTAPHTVLDAGGGELQGQRLSVSIPVLDALVLEHPIEFWLRWKK